MKNFQNTLITILSAFALTFIFIRSSPQTFLGKALFLIFSFIFIFYGFSLVFSLLQKIFGREEFYERDFWGRAKRLIFYLAFYLWGLSFLKVLNFLNIINFILLSAIMIFSSVLSFRKR